MLTIQWHRIKIKVILSEKSLTFLGSKQAWIHTGCQGLRSSQTKQAWIHTGCRGLHSSQTKQAWIHTGCRGLHSSQTKQAWIHTGCRGCAAPKRILRGCFDNAHQIWRKHSLIPTPKIFRMGPYVIRSYLMPNIKRPAKCRYSVRDILVQIHLLD